MPRPLESIDEHNRRVINFRGLGPGLLHTWVACPKCGSELKREYPPRLVPGTNEVEVFCPECGHRDSLLF